MPVMAIGWIQSHASQQGRLGASTHMEHTEFAMCDSMCDTRLRPRGPAANTQACTCGASAICLIGVKTTADTVCVEQQQGCVACIAAHTTSRLHHDAVERL